MKSARKIYSLFFLSLLWNSSLLSDRPQKIQGHYNPFELSVSCLAYQGCSLLYGDQDIMRFHFFFHHNIAAILETAKKQKRMVKTISTEQTNELLISDIKIQFDFTHVHQKDITFIRPSFLPWSTNQKYSFKIGRNFVEIWLNKKIVKFIKENKENNFLINVKALIDGEKYLHYLKMDDVIRCVDYKC